MAGIVLAVVAVSSLGYFSTSGPTTLSAAFQRLATTTTLAYSPSPGTPTYQSDAQVKTTQDSATIQAVSQAGPSGNTLLILSFIVPLALAISVYLVLKRR